MTADWQVFPASAWNYALEVDPADPQKSFAVTEAEVGDGPFTRAHAPVAITAKARRMNGWRAEDGAADPLPPSPCASDQPEETVRLIPYAAAKLRITAFPELKS